MLLCVVNVEGPDPMFELFHELEVQHIVIRNYRLICGVRAEVSDELCVYGVARHDV